MRRVLLFMVAIVCLSSCVSREKLTYLQDKKGDADSTEFGQLQRRKYQVQPNDILNITIRSFDEETSKLFNAAAQTTTNINAGDLIFYLNGYSIDPEGFIDMPVVGKVHVLGKNVDEIKILVEQKLQEYFKKNAVFVNVQLAGVRFSIVGDVARPGKYVIYQNQVNIFEALSLAGDITMVGDRKHVQIVRSNPGGVQTIELDLTDKEIISSPYFFIQPNDIINVKPLKVKSIGIGTTGFQTFASILGVLASTATLIFTLSRITTE